MASSLVGLVEPCAPPGTQAEKCTFSIALDLAYLP